MLSTSHKDDHLRHHQARRRQSNDTHERPREQNDQGKQAHRPNSTELLKKQLGSPNHTTMAPPSQLLGNHQLDHRSLTGNDQSLPPTTSPPRQHRHPLQHAGEGRHHTTTPPRRYTAPEGVAVVSPDDPTWLHLCLPTSRYATEGHREARPCDQMTKHQRDIGPRKLGYLRCQCPAGRHCQAEAEAQARQHGCQPTTTQP
jgi:hypothetical protein